jgi:hypothetical protein
MRFARDTGFSLRIYNGGASFIAFQFVHHRGRIGSSFALSFAWRLILLSTGWNPCRLF